MELELILNFFNTYGVWLGVIAVGGIALLGVLKYCHVFTKLSENIRHLAYMGVSAGLSIIASAIYIVCAGMFSWGLFLALSGAIWALNQFFYNIFKATKFNDLMIKLLEIIKKMIAKKQVDQEQE